MKRFVWCLGLLGIVLLTGCFQGATKKPAPVTMTPLSMTGYQLKVNAFHVLTDVSNSMADPYQGYVKQDLAKAILTSLNQGIPEARLDGGLRSFGKPGDATTSLLTPISTYDRTAYQQLIDSLTATSGNTPMEAGINATHDDFANVAGQTALIIVSDALPYPKEDNDPAAAVRKLKATYGSRLCIYPILVGNDPGGRALLEAMIKESGCGFVTNGGDLMDQGKMKQFIIDVFLRKAPPAPKPMPSPKPAPPLDSDGDGVLDRDDACPNTPRGAPVNARGCWYIKGLNFDTDKAVIKSQYEPALNEAVVILRANPQITIEIKGYTDSQGSEKYNQGLSERRALAVETYFKNAGIAASRMISNGYGESNPLADNTTSSGRAANRRVVIDVKE